MGDRVIAGTGHRPEDLGASIDEVYTKTRDALVELSPAKVITGMAAGFDLILGCAALDAGIEVVAARPWKGHSPRRDNVAEYARIITEASEVVSVFEGLGYPGPWVYHKRNEWMVDHATHVLAYLNPLVTRGGTYGTVQYALKQKRPIRYIYGGTNEV